MLMANPWHQAKSQKVNLARIPPPITVMGSGTSTLEARSAEMPLLELFTEDTLQILTCAWGQRGLLLVRTLPVSIPPENRLQK